MWALSLWSADLLAQDTSHQISLQHTPVATFVHGEILSVRIDVTENVDWVKFFFRHEGIEDFQVRKLEKSQGLSYRLDLDTSQFPGLEFSYYFEALKGSEFISLPAEAPIELFHVTGESAEPLPDIPEEFPSPEEEAKKFRLPVNLTGSVQAVLKEENSDSSAETVMASGNVRVFKSFSRGNLGVNFDSNFSYSNTPLEGDKTFDLSNMMLSVSKARHTLNIGDVNINESEFTVYGLGRRGLEYSYEAKSTFFHVFNVSSQQPKGFSGFGIPKSDISILGGSVGQRLLGDRILLKAIYISGRDDPQKGMNIGTSFEKARKGSVIALLEETNLFQNKLNICAEYARSDYDEDISNEIGAKSGTAWKIASNFSLEFLTASAKYNHIDGNFNPIGYQYFTNGRKGLETHVGLNFGGVNISAGYMSSDDDVDKDSSDYSTASRDANLNLMWNVSGAVSVNLGYRRNKQNTTGGFGYTALNQDSLSRELAGSVGINFGQALSLNLSSSAAEMKSRNYPQNDSLTFMVNLGSMLRLGQFLSLSPSLGYSEFTNKYTDEKMLTLNSFLTAEINFLPELLSTTFSGSLTRTERGFDDISENFNMMGSLNFHLNRIIRFGKMILSLRGNFSRVEMQEFLNSYFSAQLQFDFSF